MASTSSKVWLTLAAAVGTLVIAGVVVSAPSVQRCQGQADGLWTCLRSELIDFGLLPAELPDEPTVVADLPAALGTDTTEPEQAAPDAPPLPAGEPASPAEREAAAAATADETLAEPSSADPAPVDDVSLAAAPDDLPEAIGESSPPLPAAPKAEAPELAVTEVGPPENAPTSLETPVPTPPTVAEGPAESTAIPSTPSPSVSTDTEMTETADATPSPSLPEPLQPQAIARAVTGISVAAAGSSSLMPSEYGVVLAPVLGVRIALAAEPLRLLPPADALEPPHIPATGLAEPVSNEDLQSPVPTAVAPDLSVPTPVGMPAAATASPELGEAGRSDLLPQDATPASDAPLPTVVTTEAVPDIPDSLPPAEPLSLPGPTLIATATAAASPAARAAFTPTIDAVEIDGNSRFIAGAGAEGSTIDLYVGQRYVGSAEVEGGRWVIEARGAIAMDQLRVAIAPDVVGRASLGSQAALSFNVAPTGVRLVGKEAAAELLQVQPESQLELAPSNPALEAFVSVDPEILRFRSGKTIIRRGDTLWAIARRVYGRGIEYRLIFEANREQIRRPGRIYPGQVLVLPRAD